MLRPDDSHQLDVEFRQILSVIKQFIPYVNSNSHLSLYRSWLEKLSATNSDKRERNRYLLELARQIKADGVFPPFDQRPPIGHLKTFPDVEVRDEETEAECVTCIRPTTLSPPPYPNFTFQIPVDFDQPPQPLPPGDRQRRVPHPFPPPRGVRKAIAEPPALAPFEGRAYYADCGRPSGGLETTVDVHEDSSWCDLTDTSATSIVANSMGCGDALDRTAVQAGADAEIEFNGEHEVERDDTVDILSKPQDNQDTKFPLKDTHFISADWKKTIESLQMRLTETLSQNNELKSMIQALNAKSNYEKSNKEQMEMLQRKKAEEHVKEMGMLKTTHSEQFRMMQHSYETRMGQLEDDHKLKVEEIKADSEMRLRELKLEYDDDKREKDKEIHRLSDIIQQQCIRMSNEIVALRKQIESSLSNNNNNAVPEDKVFVLKKCVSKMDKLFHKSEKDYMKQIEKLKQELEMKDKVAQVQLRTQRAELVSRTNADRQIQIEEVVNNLEVKYIKMLEYHENQVSESKRQDEEKIEYLKDLLEKNNISFVI